MAPVKFDSAKVKYAFQSKAVETSAKLKLQNKLEFSLDHRLNGNTFKVGVSHKKFNLDYDTAGKVASAKFKHTINSSSKFSISQKVANHNWKVIPSPELEFELALVESSNYNDKLELKYGFAKHSGNIEYKAKFGGKHKCGVAADTVSKLDGANAYWRTKLVDSGLVTSVGGSFSKNEGPKLKLKSKPFSGLKLVAVGSVKTKSLDMAAEIKPKKISDKITLELGTVVSKSGKLSNTTASAKLSF